MTHSINKESKVAIQNAGDAGYNDGYDTFADRATHNEIMELDEHNIDVPEKYKNSGAEEAAYVEAFIIGARDFANDWIGTE